MRRTAQRTRPLPGTVIDPLYPDRMRRPMGYTDFQSYAITSLRETLVDFFHEDEHVYVTMNLTFYFRRGDPRARSDPDVLVARGVVGKHLRRSFRVWEEGVLPCTLFQISSEKTWPRDIRERRRLYARLNVPEYFVFDPEGIYLNPVLRGFRSVNGRAVEMTPAMDGSLESAQLGLRLTPEGSMLRLGDLTTGQRILTLLEKIAAIRQETAELIETRRRSTAERFEAEVKQIDDVACLRAELARRKKRK